MDDDESLSSPLALFSFFPLLLNLRKKCFFYGRGIEKGSAFFFFFYWLLCHALDSIERMLSAALAISVAYAAPPLDPPPHASCECLDSSERPIAAAAAAAAVTPRHAAA